MIINYVNKSYYKIILLLFILVALLSISVTSVEAADRPVYVVELDGAVTAGLNNYLQRQVDLALEAEAQLFVLKMSTPGGLVDATLQINRLFLNAPLPVAVFVAPSGAIAGSAGAFILISSDLAIMAPGTTVGAAQPIAFSPEGAESADQKTINFYAGHLRSIALEKGRPEVIAERFVTENLTLDSREALDLGVIDYIAADLEELLLVADGLQIEKQGKFYELNTFGARILMEDMNLRERLQNWLSDPQIAFLVLIVGFLGIYFGLSAPGTIVPEVSGLILVVLGIYGIGLFDTNTTGIVLLLLGLGLIIAELFTTGFGILGIGGALSMVAGAVLLPMEPLMAREWYTTFLITVVGTVIGLLIIIIFIAQRIVDSRRRYKDGSAYFNPPQKGIVVNELKPEGMIKARGELWKARSINDSELEIGREVEVVGSENLLLWVRPLESKRELPFITEQDR
jgi:membrane-bound serine protease (ClpP class)